MENKEKKQNIIVRRSTELIAAFIAAAACAVFCLWLFKTPELSPQGIVAAAVCLALFTLSLIIAVPRALRFFAAREEAAPVELMGARSTLRRRLHPLAGVFLTVFFAHILVIVLAYIIHTAVNGYNGTIFSTMRYIWFKRDTDVIHYANIAENWYLTNDKDKWALVFLPLYPIIMRAANWITRDSFVSGMILNLLFSSAAGVVIYELALCDLGRRSSRFAVFCAFALPAAIFYVAPMSEPLFLLLTALTLLLIRKKHFVAAAVTGALAAFTRSLGILLVVPYAAEAVPYLVAHCRANREAGVKTGKGLAARIIMIFFGLAFICCGFGAYLLINKLLWGDWFKFMEFQKENWYQSMGWFFNTASYQTDRLVACFAKGELSTAFGLWLPNLLYIFGALAVFIATARELRTSYVLYFAAYFAVAIGATWLLSAPRYLTALVVLPIALSKLCEARDDGQGIGRARCKQAIVGVLLAAGQIVYLAFYVLKYKLY